MEAKGAINVYTCRECGGEICTVNLAAGVTPMFLTCRATIPTCKGTMVSSGFNVPQDRVPAWCWYAPNRKNLRRMERSNPETAEHCRADGLMLRTLDPHERPQFGGPNPRAA